MNYIFLSSVLFLALLNSCHQTGRSTTETSTTTPSDSLPRVNYSPNNIVSDTTLFDRPKQIGKMTDPGLVEASGLAPSRRNPGFLWTEEDSGNPNQIQLVRPDGSVAARFTIDGATNRDWEDIAVGPGPVAGETYVYLAEIGDNKRRYPEKIIYRFPEPTIFGQTLPYAGTITKADVTSAGISPDNREILIRTYDQLFYYPRRTGESVTDALKRTPRMIPLASEPQGEAVGWAIDGSGYYTTSENPDASLQAIYWYKRK